MLFQVETSNREAKALRDFVRRNVPGLKSSHVAEALSRAMGYRTHAAFLAAVSAPKIVEVDLATELRLFGYDVDLVSVARRWNDGEG